MNLEQSICESAVNSSGGARRGGGKLLLIYYLYGGVGYYLVGHYLVGAGNHILPRSYLDERIPFLNGFVWVYILDYLLPVLMVLLLPRVRCYRGVLLSFAVVFTASFIIFIIYPVQMVRPIDPGNGLSGNLLGYLYAIDSPPINVFPSLHAAVPVLIALIVWHNNRWLGSVFALGALAISVSTLYIKQHWVLDLVVGALLGAGTYLLVYRWYSLRSQQQK